MGMTKYSKGIKVYKYNILVTDKDSWEECDKELLEQIEMSPDFDDELKKYLIKEVLSIWNTQKKLY